jgi:hypothetical protein
MKIKYIAILLTLIITSCQKEEQIECWGIVRTVKKTSPINPYQQVYWNGGYTETIQQDTSFQCGITESEVSKQCNLNNRTISDDGETSIKAYYSYYSK